LKLTDEQRRASLTQAESESGIQAKAIEKDWWVTLTLKALFNSAYANHIVFKGGTSLSKCWKVISRFSEDIDIALDPEAFNMKYEDTPTKGYVKKLKREGCKFTSTQLREALENGLIKLGIPSSTVKVEAAPVPADFPDTDPQILYVKYPSLYPPIAYIADEVKVEVSVRSLKTPFTQKEIQSILSEVFPNPVYGEAPFLVTVVEPRKTFLEKAFLLHEEFQKPDKGKIRAERMSRHPYDLVSMMETEIGQAALSDYALYDHLITHRKWYTGYTYIDYEMLGHSTIQFVPPVDFIDLYRKDYETMQTEMIYGNTKSFDELLERLKILQGKFRLKMDVKTLEEIIEEAKKYIPDALEKQPDAEWLQIRVSFISDLYQPENPHNRTIGYLVEFRRNGDRVGFESIQVQ
jgi:hypothetical protein